MDPLSRPLTKTSIVNKEHHLIGYHTILSRYKVGSSTIALIMERYHIWGMTLEDLKIHETE